MNDSSGQNKFYFNMGLLLLSLVIIGFGSVMIITGRTPDDFPIVFHLHGAAYIAWFLLFIVQAKLIGQSNYDLHKKLGYSSLAILAAMLVTGFLVAASSYARGTSPVPDTTIQNFLAFPMIDLMGLTIFYILGVLNRKNALFHKHAMLITSIAIMDPAIARIAISLGVMPLALLLHIGLIILVMLHDSKTQGRIHFITWMGLAYVVLRVVFIFTIGATEQWAALMDSMFG